MGECHVHAGINGAELRERVRPSPTPSCSSTPSAAARPARCTSPAPAWCPKTRTKILSTGGMVTRRRADDRRTKVLVATETGMLHQLPRPTRSCCSSRSTAAAVCKYMKMITPAKLLRSLREGRDEVTVPADVAERARGVGRADDRHRHPRRRRASSATMSSRTARCGSPRPHPPGSARSTSSCSARAPPGSPPRSPPARCATALDRHQGHARRRLDGVGPGRPGRRARPRATRSRTTCATRSPPAPGCATSGAVRSSSPRRPKAIRYLMRLGAAFDPAGTTAKPRAHPRGRPQPQPHRPRRRRPQRRRGAADARRVGDGGRRRGARPRLRPRPRRRHVARRCPSGGGRARSPCSTSRRPS